MRIVIVDYIDNEITSLKIELEKIAQISEVVIVDNESEALNLANESHELFILNIGLDGIDEYFINYCINKSKKVIIHTDIDDEDKIEKLNNLKIVDYIIKSIIPRIVIDTVKRIINNITYSILFYSNETDRMEIVNHIESQNFNLLEAKTVKNLINYLKNNKVDVILLDFAKSSYDDLDIVMDIRKDYSKNKLSIVMLQYFSNKKAILSSFLKAGVNSIIYKPYLKDELINIIDNSFKNLDECYLIDSRTGLYKFDFFQESGQKILNSSLRENKPISLAIIEIDNLSQTTQDDFSLIAKLLEHLASILISSLRTGDLICEYNEYKVAILMPNTSANNGYLVIDRIRQKIKELPYILNEKQSINYTISGGVAGKGGYDLSVMIDISDEYLYRAKKYGMDRIESLQERE